MLLIWEDRLFDSLFDEDCLTGLRYWLDYKQTEMGKEL